MGPAVWNNPKTTPPTLKITERSTQLFQSPSDSRNNPPQKTVAYFLEEHLDTLGHFWAPKNPNFHWVSPLKKPPLNSLFARPIHFAIFPG